MPLYPCMAYKVLFSLLSCRIWFFTIAPPDFPIIDVSISLDCSDLMASLSGLPCPLWRSLALILAKSTLKERNEVNEGITLTELDAKARASAP